MMALAALIPVAIWLYLLAGRGMFWVPVRQEDETKRLTHLLRVAAATAQRHEDNSEQCHSDRIQIPFHDPD